MGVDIKGQKRPPKKVLRSVGRIFGPNEAISSNLIVVCNALVLNFGSYLVFNRLVRPPVSFPPFPEPTAAGKVDGEGA